MSVQLIVYPQNYEGFSNSNSLGNNYLVDGLNFNTVNASVDSKISNTGGLYTNLVMNYYDPIIAVNTWYRYHDIASGNVSKIGTVLSLVSSAANPHNGILQRLSNLTIGSVYNVELGTEILIGNASIYFYTGTSFQMGTIVTGASTQTIPFTAVSTEMTIIIGSTYTSLSNLLQLNSIKVIGSVAPPPSGAIQLVEDGQVIVDLYEEEDLPLTLSVDEFKNVAEKVQSYSKAFDLPATKRNNRIFDNIFEVTRANDSYIFNPYKKAKCVLKQDGFILFEGYLRMLEISDKEGEISYNVNLYSEVIALADTLEERAFRDLDFSELEHTYNYTNIVLSETGNLALLNPLPAGSFAGATGATLTNVVRYPFVDWSHQYAFTTSGMPKLLTLESTYRPFINIKYLIDRIFNAPNTPFTYSSDFFNSTEFKKLFMDFNWGAGNNPALSDVTSFHAAIDLGGPFPVALTNYTPLALDNWSLAATPVSTVPPNYNVTSNIITTTENNEQYNIVYDYNVKNTSASPVDVECRWLYNSTTEINYSGVQTIPVGGSFSYQGTLNQVMPDIGDTLGAEFRASAGSSVEQYAVVYSSFNWAEVVFNVNVLSITSDTILQTLRGETGQWEFLKGLITMFNLVTLPDEDNPNNIKIEPYEDVFINNPNSVQLNWTDKIDVSQMNLTPLTDLNRKTIFKFVEDDDDYSFNQYKNLVGGHLYGSLKHNATDEFNILDGKDEIIAEPFAATVVKPLDLQYPGLIIPSIYSYNVEEGTTESFDNSPRILYNNGQKTLSTTTFSVPAQNGSPANSVANKFLQFSHLSAIPSSPSTLDFHFGVCQLFPGVGNPTENNLFSLYWRAYFNELYNADTRIMTIKVNLSPSDINTFKFNDTVFLKNRTFRVNKIDYKPNDLATVEFILIP